MAKIRGIVKIKGKVGEEVYYELNGKNIVRKSYKGRSHMVKTDPCYEYMRASSRLFRATNALSTALYRMAKSTGIPMNYPMCKNMNGIFKRRLHKGDLDLLKPHYGLFRSSIQGVRMDRVKTALSASIQYFNDHLRISTSGNLACAMHINIFIGTLDCPVWKKDDYIVHTDMKEVEVIQLRILPGEDNGVYNIPLELLDNQALVATIDNKYCFVV
jgi:hypothetical protein